MIGDEKLRTRWKQLQEKLATQFGDGEKPDLDTIIYLIGVQELNQINFKFKKDEKVDLMHIAICRLLEPLGYYEFSHFDDEGWPHYKKVENLPVLKAGEQSVMMKEAIVDYFLEKKYIQ